METQKHRGRVAEPSLGERLPTLSPSDVEHLSRFKWRYALEAWGFTPKQADHLLFMRWLYLRQALHD